MATFTCLNKFKFLNKKIPWTKDRLRACSLPFIYKDKRFVGKNFPPTGREDVLYNLNHSETATEWEQTLLHRFTSHLSSFPQLRALENMTAVFVLSLLWNVLVFVEDIHEEARSPLLPSHAPSTVSRTLSHLHEGFPPLVVEEEGLILAHSLIVGKSWQHPKKWVLFLSVAVGM